MPLRLPKPPGTLLTLSNNTRHKHAQFAKPKDETALSCKVLFQIKQLFKLLV